ncbi:hypothetical protein GCM10027280_61630 [Micromonospora polyrhachis]
MPAEPLTVSRLTVAPPPPVSLTLPVVAAPPVIPALDPVPTAPPVPASSEVAAPTESSNVQRQPEPGGENVPELTPEGVAPTIGVAAVEQAGDTQDSTAADSPVFSSYDPSPASSAPPVVVSRSLADSRPSAPSPPSVASPPSSPGIEWSASARAGDGPAAAIVQRSTDFLADAGSATRPSRRLGLGEPIVPPTLPMTAQRTPTNPSMPTGPVVGPPESAPAGPVMPMVQRTQAAASPSGPASNPTAPTPGPAQAQAPTLPAVTTPTLPANPSGTADLLGSEVIVSRLAESVGTDPAGQGAGTSNSEPATRNQFDELPLTDGPSPAESPRPVAASPSDPVPPPSVAWTDTAPADSVPTLGNTELATATPNVSSAAHGSADGRSIQRLTEPASLDLPLSPPAGGDRSTPSSAMEASRSTTVAAPPPVVARLIGDRPIEPLTGEGKESASPYLPAPLPPTVQRVHWGAAPDGPTGDGSTALRRAATADMSYPASGPTSTPPPSGGDLPTGAGAGHPGGDQLGLVTVVPVQRWGDVGPVPGLPRALTQPSPSHGVANPPVLAVPHLVSQPAGVLATPAVTSVAQRLPEPMMPPVAQRLPEPTTPPDPPSTVPEEPAPAPEPEPAPAPTTSGATPPPPAPGGGSPGSTGAVGAAGVAEPEELLKKLFDPLLRRLKTELRLDRERYGVLDGPD